jgi:hypothetical protein
MSVSVSGLLLFGAVLIYSFILSVCLCSSKSEKTSSGYGSDHAHLVTPVQDCSLISQNVFMQ